MLNDLSEKTEIDRKHHLRSNLTYVTISDVASLAHVVARSRLTLRIISSSVVIRAS